MLAAIYFANNPEPAVEEGSEPTATQKLQQKYFEALNVSWVSDEKLDLILAELRENPALNNEITTQLETFLQVIETLSQNIFDEFTKIDYQVDLNKLHNLLEEFKMGDKFNP